MTRDQILNAYRSLTARTPSAPPGQRSFLKAFPEINQRTFRAGTWRNWQSFQREAGVTPNTKKERFHDEPILERLAALTRALGHLPTEDDIIFARRTDCTIPSMSVVRRRGRSVEKRAVAIRAFCATRPEWQDVVQLLDTTARPVPAPTDSENAFVYLLQDGNRFKIGKSVDLDERLRAAKTWLTDPRYIWRIETDDAFGVERYWHERFKAKRVAREFFDLGPSDVAAFRRWRKIV